MKKIKKQLPAKRKSFYCNHLQSVLSALFLLSMFLFTLNAGAQNQVSGYVRQKTDSVMLAGAHVQVLNTNIAVKTDENGHFLIKGLGKGNFMLKASYIGYNPVSVEVNPEIKTEVIIELEENEITREEIIISATRANEKTPATFKNIDHTELQKVNTGKDLPFLINSMPSVIVTSDAGAGVGYTGIRIRGSDITRINVTINGVPLNDPESQMVYFVDLPDFASSVDNIQVQRGLGTSTNGPASFGASINIQTLKLRANPYAELNNNFGSFNTWKHSLSFGSGLLDGRWAIDGRISKISSDGYIDRATSDLQSYYFSAGYYGEKNIFKALIFSGKERTYQAWMGVPEDSLATHRTYNPYNYSNQVDDYGQNHYQLIWSSAILKNWTVNGTLHYTKGKGYYEEFQDTNALYSDTRFSDYGLQDVIIGHDTIRKSDFIRQRWLDNDFFGIVYSATYNNKKNFQFTLGGAWNKYDGRHYGRVIWSTYASNGFIDKNYYDNEGVKKDFNIFGKAVYSLKKNINIFVDLQYRTVNYQFVGYDENLLNVKQEAVLNFLNPKAGISFTPNNKYSCYLAFAIGNKEPNRDDYTTSKPSKRPLSENLKNVEAGFHYKNGKLAYSVNAFYMDYKNQLVLTGKINENSEYIRTNIPKSYRSGIEFDGNYEIVKWVSVYADAAWSVNKIQEFTEYIDNWDDYSQTAIVHKNTDISFSPAVVGSATLVFKALKNLDIELFTKYAGKQYLDNTSNSDRMLKAWCNSDLRFYYIIKKSVFREISLNVMFCNIFNKKYESNGWTYTYSAGNSYYTENSYYPQAGFNFMTGIGLKF